MFSESKPRGSALPGPPSLRRGTPAARGAQTARCSAGAGCPGGRPAGAGPSTRYLSECAQLHDDPDGVLRDDADQLHDVRVVKLTHRYWGGTVPTVTPLRGARRGRLMPPAFSA